MVQLFSGQLPTVPGNFIPGGNGDQSFPKNYLMVGESDNQCTVVGLLKPGDGTTIAQIKALLPAHHVDDGSQDGLIVMDSGKPVEANGFIYWEWWMTDTGNQYDRLKYPVLVVDNNNNGTYEPETDKLIPFSDFPFRTVWSYAYNKNYNFLVSQNSTGGQWYPFAHRLLNAFLSDANMTAADIQAGTFTGGNLESIFPNAFRLSHNVGVKWVPPNAPAYYTKGAVGQIKRWIVPASGDSQYYAWYTLRNSDFVAMISAVLRSHQAEVNDAFSGPNAPPSKTFGPWALPNALSFTSGDFYYAIKEATIPNMTCTVGIINDANQSIASVVLQGYLEDLYDFDYGNGGNPQSAAIVQTGYPTLGSSGRVYILQISFTSLDMAANPAPDGKGPGPFYHKAMNNLP